MRSNDRIAGGDRVTHALGLLQLNAKDVKRVLSLRQHYIGLALQYGVSVEQVARALAMSEDVVLALVEEVPSDAS